MQPYEGRSLWVWHLVDIEDIIKKAKAINADTVIVKSHDGKEYWSQFIVSNVHKLHDAGLHVGAWGYCYPNNLSAQANCVKRAFTNGADFYVCDAEIEFEHVNLALTADALMDEVRRITRGMMPIGFTSFAFPSYHPNFPWAEFARYSDFTMPQIYWGDFNRDVHSAFTQSVNEYKKLGKPVVPIGQLYGGVSNSEIEMFLQLSGQNSSWWDYAHLTPNQYSVFTKGGANMQQGSTGPEVTQLQKDLSLVLKTTIKSDGSYGPVTTSAVKSFQQQYGVRPVDGIAGPVTLAVLKHEVSLHTPKPAPTPAVQPKVETSQASETKAILATLPLPPEKPPVTIQKEKVAQARDLITQALKLLEGVE